jgi:four helix bundle suffix protein
MVQAARSGVQNIAEGSQASGTSRKMELKLTNVACALLDRQIAAQARDFESEGGFTERLHRVRSAARRSRG